MDFRLYQHIAENEINDAWLNKFINVLLVMPTGGGKTRVLSNLVLKHVGQSCVIAHRQELVSQISLALALNGVRHRIIAPNNVIRWIVQLQVLLLGRSYYDPTAGCAVAGVDTIINRTDELKEWLPQVTLWVIDEAHHVVNGNKWDKAVKLFPNAKGLGVTATPLRADGKGLGRHADGVFDTMVIGPTMRELINQGYLCDYRIFNPPSDLDLTPVTVSKVTGDYNPQKLKLQVRKSHIVGDVVKHYQRIAPGKQAIVFASDVETADDIASDFRLAGVKTEIITGKTKDKIRVELLQRFKTKQIQVIVNVDILGEGFDVPGIEVGIFARPTQSYGLYVQQFGRVLRILAGKTHAIIIDHVGNVIRHGLPDAFRKWTLDRRERGAKNKKDPDAIPLRTCLNVTCMAVYEAIYKQCPYCGTVHIPAGRSSPEFVDGDLTELDPETLRAMRGEIERIDSVVTYGNNVVSAKIAKNHILRQEAQALLREAIMWWAGHQESLGRPMSEIYRRFYFKFGHDVMTAQTLGRKEATELAALINIDTSVTTR